MLDDAKEEIKEMIKIIEELNAKKNQYKCTCKNQIFGQLARTILDFDKDLDKKIEKIKKEIIE